MKPELKELLERLGPIRGLSRVSTGSPFVLAIRPLDGLAGVRTIDAMKALAYRGMTLLKAKRAVEAMVENGLAYISVPTVESLSALAEELRAAGVLASRLRDSTVDVKALRERLSLTQEQFALRFALALDAVRNWEQGRSEPDTAAMAYLRAIEQCPIEVAAAQEEAV